MSRVTSIVTIAPPHLSISRLVQGSDTGLRKRNQKLHAVQCLVIVCVSLTKMSSAQDHAVDYEDDEQVIETAGVAGEK